MKIYEIITQKDRVISEEELLEMFPGSERDIAALNSSVQNQKYEMRLKIEPFSKFRYTALTLWKDLPADQPTPLFDFLNRILKIVKLLRKGKNNTLSMSALKN